MSRNGTGKAQALKELNDEELRAVVIACLEIIAEREERTSLEIVDECRDAIFNSSLPIEPDDAA